MFFKSIDKKIEKLGFKKVKDNEFVVSYERENKKFNYTQVVDIYHKQNGNNIIQSYDKNLFDSKNIGNTCVGLTYTETKLFLRKMKLKKWKN